MPHVPSDEDLKALELLDQRDDLSEWEQSFIESLNERQAWTDKQRAKFDSLCDEKFRTA